MSLQSRHQEGKRACRKFSNFFGHAIVPWICLETSKREGETKYLQPLLMTIRVICSLFPEKGHNFHQTRKGTSWSGPLLWSWWCSLVSGYCYTKSGSKGPILCPRKDNENPTTTDETFNAFFLLFWLSSTSKPEMLLHTNFGPLFLASWYITLGRKEIGKKQDKQQWKLHTLWLYSLRCKCKCSTTFLINAFFPALVWESCKVIT